MGRCPPDLCAPRVFPSWLAQLNPSFSCVTLPSAQPFLLRVGGCRSPPQQGSGPALIACLLLPTQLQEDTDTCLPIALALRRSQRVGSTGVCYVHTSAPGSPTKKLSGKLSNLPEGTGLKVTEV